MSKLLRLPLTLLAVLAALFFLPGVAFGETQPTAEPCAAESTAPECAGGAGSATVGDSLVPGDLTGQTGNLPAAGTEGTGTSTGQEAGDAPQGDVAPTGRLAGTSPGPVVGLDAPAPIPGICTLIPTFPTCPGAETPPSGPLTCDELAALLGQGATGCPAGVSCDQLAALFGVTCPTGPPTCETLAALFNLEGCPPTPTSCHEFADLLGVDDCSDIPCLDTSQLPHEARDGLAPLLDGLKAIGIKECPARPTTTGGGTGNTQHPGQGTQMPITPAAQQPYYANCDDARAKGAAPINAGQPGYRPELDSDSDGIGCETETQPAVAAASTQPTGRLAYTGLELGPQLNVAWTLLVLGAGLLIVGRRRA
jgi:hypothetical protein